MSLSFVGRKNQIELVVAALREPFPGPIVITGEPGMGRSSTLATIVRRLDRERDAVVAIEPAGAVPLAALRPLLPTLPSAVPAMPDLVAIVAAALADRTGGRRPVIAVDDVHLADHASMQVLCALNSQQRAVLLLTNPAGATPGTPDPIDCIRYQRDTRTITLPPLDKDEVASVLAGLAGPVHPVTVAALHAASGGNPKVLHDLVADRRLLPPDEPVDAMWRLPEPRERNQLIVGAGHAGKLIAATQLAWRDLAVDRVEELCQLAAWHGSCEQIAPIWAITLLLRGRTEQSLRTVGPLATHLPGFAAQQVLARAMGIALGRQQPEAAAEYLDEVARDLPALRERVLAYRAWLLASTGRPDSLVEPAVPVDRETALFRHAAKAISAGAANNTTEAIYHLRRARIAAEGCRDTVPWMCPVLLAGLIDMLLMSRRTTEATEIASEFHAGKPGCGWDVAVAMSTLVSATLRTLAAEELQAA